MWAKWCSPPSNACGQKTWIFNCGRGIKGSAALKVLVCLAVTGQIWQSPSRPRRVAVSSDEKGSLRDRLIAQGEIA